MGDDKCGGFGDRNWVCRFALFDVSTVCDAECIVEKIVRIISLQFPRILTLFYLPQ